MLRHSLRFFLLPMAGILVAVIAGLVVLRSQERDEIRVRRAIPSPPGIDVLEPVRLGGIEQWISIRGRDRSNPILLFLHGGPGGSALINAHLFQDAWEEHFTVVHWDQRGTGKTHRQNGREGVATLTVDRLLGDGVELIEHLRRRLGQPKVLILGHSWGAYLGMRLVLEYPELVSAYVGVGQLVNTRENYRLSYEQALRLARQRGGRRAIARLEQIGPPPYPLEEELRNIGVVQSCVLRYGGSIYAVDSLWDLVTASWRLYLVAPEYSLEDVYYGVEGARLSFEALRDEFMSLDLVAFGDQVEVPVFFFLGRHDAQTPPVLAARYLETLDAPHKELVWFEESAHAPMLEEPERFAREMVERVWPFAAGELGASGEGGAALAGE